MGPVSTGASMPRALAVVVLCLSPPAAIAQPVYVAVAAGAESVAASRLELLGTITRDSGGTAPFVGARVGIALGTRWGVDLEGTYRFEVSQHREEPDRASQFLDGLPVISFLAIADTESQVTTINPQVWFAQEMTSRVSVVLLAGATFNRTATDERVRYTLERSPLPPGFPGIVPGLRRPDLTTHSVVYDVGPLVGLDVRLAFGDHLAVVPGVRLSGLQGGWSIRPGAALAWTF
jgi:hypothetical protein